MRKALIGLAAIAAVLALGSFLFIRLALPGLSSARNPPPDLEVSVATWLLQHSVPAEVALRKNPLAPDEANLSRGAALFQENCATCHGFDGAHVIISTLQRRIWYAYSSKVRQTSRSGDCCPIRFSPITLRAWLVASARSVGLTLRVHVSVSHRNPARGSTISSNNPSRSSTPRPRLAPRHR